MRKILKSLVIGLSLFVLPMSQIHGATTIKREFRSTWISTAWALDWPKSGKGTSASVVSAQKAELTEYFEQLAACNFTSVCLQVRARSDAFYKSSYAPWAQELSGTRGTNPGWDPLEYAVSEAHRLGLELYAWINPYRWSTASSDPSTAKDNEWKNNGWIMRYSYVDGSTTKYLNYLNPGLSAVKEHVLNVATEIVDGYEIDGLIIDDYFYPNGIPHNSSAADYSTYQSSGTSLSIGAWRRQNVNNMVTAIYNMIQQHKPDVRFGIAPPGVAGASASALGFPAKPSRVTASDWQYDGQATDPLQWLKSGIIDFISPQIYWTRSHSTAPFGPLCEWWSECAAQVNRHHYTSHTISEFSSSNTNSEWSERVEQIKLNREYTLNNAPGFCLFRAAYINGPLATGFGDYLKTNATPCKSLQPTVTWKNDKVYQFGSVAGATKSGNTLKWTAVSHGNRLVKYTVYAVPDDKTLLDVTRSDDDGIEADYLLGVTYTNSYSLPSGKRSGYWYAVCVYDGFSNEFAPALIGYTALDNAPATTLVSPNNGATVEGDISFTWRSVSVDSYTLQIATDESFSSIKWSGVFTGTKATINASQLGKGKFYWRVVSRKTNCNPSMSSSRTFNITKVSVGTYEDGYTVVTDGAKYSTYGKVSLTNIWSRGTQLNNFPAQLGGESAGTYNRDMVAAGDYIYLSGRSANSSTADLYLRKYDRFTGEHIADVSLASKGQVSFYPCNGVIKDSQGNVCITNLVLNVSTTPLKLFMVDTETGDLTEAASLTYSSLSETPRVDHAAVTGDVANGNFTVFAAVASSKYVIRWIVEGGKLKSSAHTTLASLYPTSAANMGIAPVVVPVGDDDFFVNGASTALTRYKFVAGGTATLTGSFSSSSSDVKLTSATYNGGTFFDLDGTRYLAYPASKTSANHYFHISKTNSSMSYGSMELRWVLPKEDGTVFGDHNAGVYQAVIDYLPGTKSSSVDVYTYVPGAGIAAYELVVDNSPATGVEDLTSDKPSVTVKGSTIEVGAWADEIAVYNLAGAKLASGIGTSLDTELTSGCYIVKVIVGGRQYASCVALR